MIWITGGLLILGECVILSWLVFQFMSGVASAVHGAPYVPIPAKAIRGLLAYAGAGPQDIFYDLGAGDGRVVICAVREFDVSRAVGYEIAPWPYWKSRWHLRRLSLEKAEVRHRSFFDAELGEATCVYAYLFPKLLDRLASKLEKELKPGARVLCPSFSIDVGKHPQFRLKKEEKIGTLTAYLYEKT